jgi:hypothetical protein
MITKLKREFSAFMALGECVSYGDKCPSLLVPSLKGAGVLPLTGTALCLLSLQNKNVKITPKLLMSQYGLWIGQLAKHQDADVSLLDPQLLQSVHQYLANHMNVSFFAPNEMHIDSSGLTRLGPLAFYLVRYKTMFEKNPPAMYNLIHLLGSLSVGHRRASLAIGLYLAVCTTLIEIRLKKPKALTALEVKKAGRLAIAKALLYYNSTYEYKGETGHYALLQLNKQQQMHLETVAFSELNQSSYAVDVVISSLWILFNVTKSKAMFELLSSVHLPQLGVVASSLFALAYGEKRLSGTYKKRFEEILESLKI